MANKNSKKSGKSNSKYGSKEKKFYGRKNNGSRGKEVKETVSEADHSGDINDISYYTPSGGQVLIDQLNTYSFDGFAGMSYGLGELNYKDSGTSTWRHAHVETDIANIMQIALNPSAGFTSSVTPQADGINVAGLRNFTRFSAENGKTTQYSPEDTTLLLLAVGQVLAMFSFGARALGLVRTYNYRNRSYPLVIIKAAGFDPDDLTYGKYAACVMDYNTLINKFNKIPIPKNVAYFDKCAKMFQNVYLDEEGSSMAQSYCFVPRSTWKYKEADIMSGGKLETVDVCKPATSGSMYTISWSAYVSLLDSMLNELLNSSLLNYVYSDILRINIKQGVELLKLSELGYDYAILPNRSTEIATWVNNLIVVGNPNDMDASVTIPDGYTPKNDVLGRSSTNSIQYRPYWRNDNYTLGDFRPIINFMTDNPSIEERVAATRLHTLAVDEADGTSTRRRYSDVALCDWYVVNIHMTSGVDSSTDSDISSTLRSFGSLINQNGITALSDLTKFDWHPYLYVFDHTSPIPGMIRLFGDVQFYTSIEFKLLKRMDDVALLGLFEIR